MLLDHREKKEEQNQGIFSWKLIRMPTGSVCADATLNLLLFEINYFLFFVTLWFIFNNPLENFNFLCFLFTTDEG